MNKQVLKARGVTLPSPTALTVADEIIWTSDTGRTLSGLMVGDVVAEKKNLSIKWEFIPEDEMILIKNNLTVGFFPFTFYDDGLNITITSYRGTLGKDHLGTVGSIYYYRTVTVDIIQR